MKFEKLRLTGFKSFVDPTEFHIDPGLTGVVGPNGCGKSNLLEALRWVMGETSYKNMRASSMEDVIFSGNSARPSRNSAEVGLVLNNFDRTAPAAFNNDATLEITRRIQRDAGSVYRVNGREVRARDVQLLFADASTGARSPAMVRQGEISEIIAQKPTQRRIILEEAAGITGLHTRRHEAELRLRAADQNLTRIEDVLVTMERQLDSLKKQAKQATRFRNLSGEIRKAEAALHYLRFVEAADVLHDAEELLTEANALIGDRAKVQGEMARDQAVAAHEMPRLREAEAEKGAALRTLVSAAEQLDAEEKRTRERLRELETRVAQFADDLAREQQQITDTQEHLERLQAEERELRDRESGADEAIAGARRTLDEAVRDLHARERLLADKTRENADLSAERRTLERQVESERDECARVARKLEGVGRDLAAVEAQLADLDGGEDLSGLLLEADERLCAAEDAHADAEAATEAARQAEVAMREPLSEAERALQSIDTEIRTLDRILSSGAAASDEPAVVDALKVPSGLEKALGAALGDDLDAPVSGSAPVRWGGTPPSDGDGALPETATPFSDLIQGPPQLARRLRQIGLIEEADGPRLQGLLAPGQRLVARSGALWRWDGLAKDADAPSAAAERMETRNRLEALQGERPAMADKVAAAKEALAAAREKIDDEKQRETAAREATRAIRDEITDLRDRIAEVQRKRAKLASQHASLDDHKAALTNSRTRVAERLAEAEQKLGGLPDVAGLEQQLLTLRTEVAELRGKTSEMRASVDGQERERETRKRRLAAILEDAGRVRRRAESAEAHLATLTERREGAVQELQTLRDQPDDVAARRRSVSAKIEIAEAELAKASDARSAGEVRLAELDRLSKAANDDLAKTREAQIRAEERVASAREKLSGVQARIVEELECSPLEAAKLAEFPADGDLPAIEGVERRLERLKAERERLGGVNLRADEEYREVETRRDELVNERDDLVAAISKLRQAVASLNREARERLLGAFETVQNHFRELFTSLFGGGTAELRLVDADDPLEAGLEIFARPPGKKPQTMTLLSGGEQALTTMALIFAVFLTNPAPICVLDEVDAPLDDANVERFCDLLDSMAGRSDTRFLTITHNPITMARMNRLYGVTMVERGVSQLVSVDLEEAERFLEAV